MTLNETDFALLAELDRRGRGQSNGCLWPAPFDQADAESAHAFLRIVRTWNESEGKVDTFPDWEFLPVLAREWRECRDAGRPLIIEKSRRLMTSWFLRVMELHDLGLKRGNWVVTHLTNDDASGHVWRIWHLYEDLRRRFPDWRLGAPQTYGPLADERLDSLILPNGSKIEKHYEQPAGLQGSGFSGITLEELSMYRAPARMFDQANKVVQASAGGVNGLVCVVTNANLAEDWWLVKKGASASPY